MRVFRNMHFLFLCYQMSFLADLLSSILRGNYILFQRLFIETYYSLMTAKLSLNYLQIDLFLRGGHL